MQNLNTLLYNERWRHVEQPGLEPSIQLAEAITHSPAYTPGYGELGAQSCFDDWMAQGNPFAGVGELSARVTPRKSKADKQVHDSSSRGSGWGGCCMAGAGRGAQTYNRAWEVAQYLTVSSSSPFGISLPAPFWCHRSVCLVRAVIGDLGLIYNCCHCLPAGCSGDTLGQPRTCNNIRNTRNTWSRPATRPATTGRLGDTDYQHGSISRQGRFLLLPRFYLSTLRFSDPLCRRSGGGGGGHGGSGSNSRGNSGGLRAVQRQQRGVDKRCWGSGCEWPQRPHHHRVIWPCAQVP